MRIWFDITNSPHVNFFAQTIRALESDGHTCLITCRPLANTIELLDLHGFEYEIVGRHYGRSSVRKVGGFFARCFALFRHLRKRNIDVAISQSSYYSPLVARMIGAPSVYMNDNEHAAGNRPAFLCANRILVPEFLSTELLRKQWAKPAKIHHYPGVKEGIYLWHLRDRSPAGSPEPESRRPQIFVRTEPWTAQYYRGAVAFMDELLIDLTKLGDVLLLPRGEAQAEHYRDPRFENISIPDVPLTLEDFQRGCDLFVGAGGTMTREAAVLGIPTVSIYQDELLAVDRFLVECGAMLHNPEADADFIASMLNDAKRREPNRLLLDKGQRAFEMINKALYELGGAKGTASAER